MKKAKLAKAFLDELEKLPSISIACKVVGISRQTAYRWMKNSVFEAKVNKAMDEGTDYMNDMTEGQLFKLVQERNWSSIRYWLSNRHPKYKVPWRPKHEPYTSEKMSPEDAKAMDEMLVKFIKPQDTDE